MPKKFSIRELHDKSNLSLPAYALTPSALKARGNLSDRFIIPPFSVLDARQGYWQARKKIYLGMGLKSELGRGEQITFAAGGGEHVTENGLNYYRNRTSPGGQPRPAMKLVDGHTVRGTGTGKRLAESYNSGGPGTLTREMKRRERSLTYNTAQWVKDLKGEDFAGLGADTSGTSVFDPVLCELMYTWFCPPHGIVLDPFAGGSVRGIIATLLERGYVGIDLRPEQTAANYEQKKEIVPGAKRLVWVSGDARDVDEHVGSAKFDFLFTCPPYFNLELYSNDPADLSNAADYEEFLDSYTDIMHRSLKHLRRDRFAAVVVGNLRAKDGRYHDLVGDTVDIFEDAGLLYYNEAVLLTAVGSLPIRADAQFRHSRKLGKTHQNILIFCKGNPVRAAEAINAEA